MKRARALMLGAVGAMLLDVVLTFLVAPDARLFRAQLTSRIFYYHVPAAWVAYLAFGVTAVASFLHLRRPSARSDAVALASAEVGTLFALVALGTGVVWSSVEFSGSYVAAKDPAVLSLAVVILSYFAYFALRAGVEERTRRARLAAVFGLLAFLGVPLSYFAIKVTVHPDFTRPDQTLDGELAAILAYSTLAFTLLYAALVHVRYDLARADERIAILEESR